MSENNRSFGIGLIGMIIALGVVFGISAGCMADLAAYETKQIEACTKSGGSWVLAQGRTDRMECRQL